MWIWGAGSASNTAHLARLWAKKKKTLKDEESGLIERRG
jgi:hypothetical protein